MPKARLTPASVNRIRPPETGQLDIFDSTLPGFGLRIGKSGTKTWFMFYRYAGKQRRHKVGRYPALSLMEAREAAHHALRVLSRGDDPGTMRRELERQREGVLANTVAVIAQKFIEDHVTKKRSGAKMTQMLERDVVQEWGDRPIATITRRDALELLRGVYQRGPHMSNRVLEVMRLMFNWAVLNEYVETSPVAGLHPLHDERSRDRILSDEEVVALWAAFDGLDYPYGPLFKLLLVTGQRRSEVAYMRRGDVNMPKKLWILPREFTKADRAHAVPLSPLALDILHSLPVLAGDFLFSSTGGERGVSGFSRAKDRVDAKVGSLVAPWRLHDLRRTAASGMARLGVPPHVLARVINHAPGSTQGVTAIYNRHAYETEKRHALEAWANHLTALRAHPPTSLLAHEKRT